MRIIIEPDAAALARRAANRVAALIRRSPGCVLGLSTGRTPLALYSELVRRHREEGLSFARVVIFGLDDYVGLPPEHGAGFTAYMSRNLFDHVDIDPANIHVLDGGADNLSDACESYEAAISEAGGIDLQILGIGRNGHIGFNEPGSSLGSRTRLKTLTRETCEANAPAFENPDELPRLVITMGVGTILEARSCLLLALGEEKALPVRDMVEGPITAQVPASALQLHPDAISILDEGAASRLLRRDYYRDAEEAQRHWS
ncbi:MAG: glucosamine-6-phosphate deaminase [Gemmatimonadales bacterium]